MKKTLAILSLALTGGVFNASAQDIHFSHFFENAQLRNPALTGIFSGDYKAVLNYRSQWGSIATPFQTVLASFEARSLVNDETGDAVSYGLTVSYDKAGSIDFTTLQIYPAIAYNKSLEDKHGTFLTAGFSGGYVQRSVDQTKMTFDNQYIPGIGYLPSAATGETLNWDKTMLWDLSAGLSLNSSAGTNNQVTYYLGVAAYHLNRPKAAFDNNDFFVRLNTKWSGNLGVQWRMSPNFSMAIHANYLNQWPYQETIVGALVGWRNFDNFSQKTNFGLSVGAFYRFDDAIVPTVRIDYNNYSFLYSYDVNNSSLKPSLNGGAGSEITIVLRGRYKKHLNPTDQVICPHFEDPLPGYQDQ